MGTQGTGKSTLVDLFLSENPHYNRSFNIQRILNSKFNLSINGGADYMTQFAISSHYACEVNAHEDYISDRTIIDTFVYAKTCNKISSEELHYIESIFEKAVEDYDYIFYLDIEFRPPEDGVRITDDSYRETVNGYFKEYLKKYPNIIQLSGSIQERYEDLSKHIKESK